MGALSADEIPLLLMLFHLFGKILISIWSLLVKTMFNGYILISSKTLSVGEFGWGGTSVKQ